MQVRDLKCSWSLVTASTALHKLGQTARCGLVLNSEVTLTFDGLGARQVALALTSTDTGSVCGWRGRWVLGGVAGAQALH